MTTDKPSAPGPSLSDLASRINTEFAAIQKAEHDTNKSAVQRAISLGRTLSQAKEKIGHGKWEKWLNDNCREISARTAQRYMKLADSSEVRAALGKNDTVSDLSLRAALALANRNPKPSKPSDEYDRAEGRLLKALGISSILLPGVRAHARFPLACGLAVCSARKVYQITN